MSSKTAWGQMIARCYDPKHEKYHRYGARGIRVCDRWICFRLFAEDMGVRPSGMTLNRINNNGNYCQENCEWASAKTQARNTGRNRMITFEGKTKSVSEWAEITGIKRRTLNKRLEAGWSTENAFKVEVTAKNKIKGFRDDHSHIQ